MFLISYTLPYNTFLLKASRNFFQVVNLRIFTRNCPHFEIEWFITDKAQNFTSISKLEQCNIKNDFIFLDVEKTLMIIFISLKRLYTNSISEKIFVKILKWFEMKILETFLCCHYFQNLSGWDTKFYFVVIQKHSFKVYSAWMLPL